MLRFFTRTARLSTTLLRKQVRASSSRVSPKYNSILDSIGCTPVVRVNKLAPNGVNIFVKVEAFNPLSSIKDRLALGVIEDAEQKGVLKPGGTVVEMTSGNTGIGLAMVCAAKGYKLVCVMPESFSIERRKILRFLGAKVVLTPAAMGGAMGVHKCFELAEKHGWFNTKQFENEANADFHSKTTAHELLEQFPPNSNDELYAWVTGYGTGGTLKGVSRVLKEKSPNTKVVVCEPASAPLVGTNCVPKDPLTYEAMSAFKPHIVQGWTPNFVPKLTLDTVKEGGWIDEMRTISDDDAVKGSVNLARKEGIYCGISSGATFACALEVAREAPEGSTICAMLPDTGERYLSTPLYAGIELDMNEEEMEISKSTPLAQFEE